MLAIKRQYLIGRIAAWALRKHIALELRPHCEAYNVDRESAYEVSCARFRTIFDAAWPTSTN